MNEKSFQWLISSLVAIVLALVGLTYNNLTSQMAGIDMKIEGQTNRVSRINNRLFVICERIVVIEIATQTSRGSCGYE